MTPEEFRKIRKDAGYSQEQLGIVLGKSRLTIINYEKGSQQWDKLAQERMEQIKKETKENEG